MTGSAAIRSTTLTDSNDSLLRFAMGLDATLTGAIGLAGAGSQARCPR